MLYWDWYTPYSGVNSKFTFCYVNSDLGPGSQNIQIVQNELKFIHYLKTNVYLHA